MKKSNFGKVSLKLQSLFSNKNNECNLTQGLRTPDTSYLDLRRDMSVINH